MNARWSPARFLPRWRLSSSSGDARTQTRTFHSQHRGDDEAAHPQQLIHCHQTGVCNMKKKVCRANPPAGGDSDAERRSRALCSSRHRRAAGAGEGLRAPPLTETVGIIGGGGKKVNENVFLLLCLSDSLCYPAVLGGHSSAAPGLFRGLYRRPSSDQGRISRLLPGPGLTVRTRVWSGLCAPGSLRDPKLLLVWGRCASEW